MNQVYAPPVKALGKTLLKRPVQKNVQKRQKPVTPKNTKLAYRFRLGTSLNNRLVMSDEWPDDQSYVLDSLASAVANINASGTFECYKGSVNTIVTDASGSLFTPVEFGLSLLNPASSVRVGRGIATVSNNPFSQSSFVFRNDAPVNLSALKKLDGTYPAYVQATGVYSLMYSCPFVRKNRAPVSPLLMLELGIQPQSGLDLCVIPVVGLVGQNDLVCDLTATVSAKLRSVQDVVLHAGIALREANASIFARKGDQFAFKLEKLTESGSLFVESTVSGSKNPVLKIGGHMNLSEGLNWRLSAAHDGDKLSLLSSLYIQLKWCN